MSYEIYYHPSAKIYNISPNNHNNSKFDLLTFSVESYRVKLNNEDNNLKHLPDNVFYNLKESYQFNIDKDGTIRNDRALNFIRDCIYEEKNLSIFLLDNEATISLDADNSKRLTVIAFGEEFQIANKHISSSPVNKINKSLFISKYYEYCIPNSENIKNTNKVSKF